MEKLQFGFSLFHQRDEIVSMASARDLGFTVLVQPLPCKLMQRFQQEKARFTCGVHFLLHQILIDQRCQRVQNIGW